MKLELQYWMLGYYTNGNAKLRGSILKAKVQSLFYGLFVNIYVDLRILIQQYIQIDKTHNIQQLHTHPHTNTPTYK